MKFRAWDKTEKRMVEEGEIMLWGNGAWGAYREGHEELSSDGDLISSDPYTDKDMILMQFTGLHDKNGQDIYEGDIIHCDNGSVGTIIYYKENMMYKVDSGGKCGFCHPVYGYAPPFEVIGNIYENKELI
jgi:uncharacterized phage protein (TIGR01671 family)